MLEKEIEKKLKIGVEKKGGICYKFTSPNKDGVPDRLILINGYSIFVETKAPDKKPRPLQKKQIRDIQKRGIPVYIISTIDEIDTFLNEELTYFLNPNNFWYLTENDKSTKHKSNTTWIDCVNHIQEMAQKANAKIEANGRTYQLIRDDKILTTYTIQKHEE